MEKNPDEKRFRTEAERRLEGKLLLGRSADDNTSVQAELSIHQEEQNFQNEELRQIQLELEFTKAKYFELYDLAPLGYITLSPELMIKEANLAASKILECDRGDLINKGISSFVSKDSQESLYLHYKRLSQGKAGHGDVFAVHWMNGTEVQIQFESNLVDDRPEKGFRSILTDVTRLKNAEEALKQVSDELEKTVQARIKDLENSNSELQQFAYVASHDLQEPLRMVISYLSLLQKRYLDKLEPEAQEFIQIAVEGGKRMRALIEDLLSYSRIDSHHNQLLPTDMNDVVKKTLNGLAIRIRDSKADMIIGPMPVIMADESQMLQVMQNLIINAIKFHGPERPVIRISAKEQGKNWTFSVQDNGIGLDEEYSEKIFVMFQRLHTKAEYPGTGIGLAIVKKIVERLGGRIWVESKKGEGATFNFTIPKAVKIGQ
jgi:chemotaxis family two-component system sensor kinase Cph1